MANRNVLVARQRIEQGRLPIRRHENVVVQEGDTGRVDRRQPTVARRRETGIAREGDKSNIGEVVPDLFLVASILHDDGCHAAWR